MNEHSGNRSGATAFPPVLLRDDKWRGPAGHLGVQHRLGNQSLVDDARPRLKERTHAFCSRERLEEELELNVAYHHMLESF